MYSFIGIFLFLFFFFAMLHANARRWRVLAKHYTAHTDHPVEKKNWQSGVLVSTVGFNALKGILTLGVHQSGISIRVPKPLSLFHKSLFIPYEDIIAWQATSYLDEESVELQFKKTPNIKFVISKEQAEWLQSFANKQWTLENTRSPYSTETRWWHAYATAHAGVMLGGIFVLFFMAMG